VAPTAPSNSEQSTTTTEIELSVTAAAELVATAIAEHVRRPLRIVGQVSGLSRKTHWYFNLKDENSVIQCVMWQGRAARAPTVTEGDEIRATGIFEFWTRSGRAQFIVERLEARGMGSLEARFRALCAELEAKGWFEEERKPRLPLLPRHIAIITSRTGAALRDCLATAAARCPGVAITVIDVPVQGDGAAKEIARAIRRVDAVAAQRGFDAILVTRGGGSREDLWAFNERVVAEAAYACRTPLVAAIGHEPDVEIIELVAHRAATPTRGIVMLIPDRAALLEQLAHWRARAARAAQRRHAELSQHLAALGRHALVRRPAEALLEWPRAHLAERRRDLFDAMRRRLDTQRVRLVSIERRTERIRPHARVASAQERMAQLARRVHRALEGALARRRQTLEALERHLAGIGPEQVLARGYSITSDHDGRIVRDAAALTPGERVRTRVAHGTFESDVVSAEAPERDPRP